MVDKWKHGILTETYHILDTDGSWQEMTMPDGVSGKEVLLQVHVDDDTIYDPDVACKPFLYSHDETEGWTVVPKEGLKVNIRNSGRSALLLGIGKIKAATGDKVSIMIVD